MQIFLKSLSSGIDISISRKYIDIEPDETIGKLRNNLCEENEIAKFQLVLIYSGKPLEDEHTFEYYNIGKDSTIYCIGRNVVYPKGEFYEIDNFFSLIEARNEEKKNDDDSTTKSSDSEQKKLFSLLDPIIQSGVYGPLIVILSFIDPVEIMLNLRSINSIFFKSFEHLVEHGKIKFNENHLFLIFGRKKLHINEELFLYLSQFNDIWDEDTVIFARKDEKKSVLELCVEKNFLRGLKYVIEKRSFRKLPTTITTTNSSQSDILEKCVKSGKSEVVVDLMTCFIDNFDNNDDDGFFLTQSVFKELYKSQKWEYIIRLLKNTNNSNKLSFLHSFPSSSDFSSLEKFRVLEEIVGQDELFTRPSDNFKSLRSFFLQCCFHSKWELLRYVLEHPKLHQVNFKFEVSQHLVKMDEFHGYIIQYINNERKKNNNTGSPLNLEIYPERFILIDNCMNNKHSEVLKILEDEQLYNIKKDIHYKKLAFPYSKVSNCEIMNTLLSMKKIFPIHSDEYRILVESEKYELADILEEQKISDFDECDNDYIFFRDHLTKFYDNTVMVNLQKSSGRREDIVLRMLKNYKPKVEYLENRYGWYIIDNESWKMDEPLYYKNYESSRVLKISIEKDYQKIVKYLIDDLLPKEWEPPYDLLDMLFRLVKENQKKDDDDQSTRRRIYTVGSGILKKFISDGKAMSYKERIEKLK